MARLPFNPADMAIAKDVPKEGAPAGPLPQVPVAQAKPLTVTQLAGLIDRVVRDGLPTGLKVVGEIGQFRERTHWYFDLKDEGALINCAMWASAARKVGFTPAPGQQVLVTGRVEYYQPYGKTQLIVDRLEPVGAGALDLAFRKLVEELRAEGYFDEARKRPLPLLPSKVAVVTSRTGAALQDVLDTVARRCPSLKIALVDVRVQGQGAAAEIAAAVRALGRRHRALGVDVILVTRGGGSMEDLWAFNERTVADAIVASPIPVVAAIGHETDTTVAELCADVRGATPTQAAMRIAPDAEALRRQLASLGARLRTHVGRQIDLDAQRLRGAARHPLFSDPARVVDEAEGSLELARRDLAHAARERVRLAAERLDRAHRRLEGHRPDAVYARIDARLRGTEARLRAAMGDALCRHNPKAMGRRLAFAVSAGLQRRGLTLEGAARALDLVGPQSVLRRGYSITTRADGTPVRSSADVIAGETVRTRVADGAFASVVTGDGPAGGAAPLPPSRQARAGRKPRAAEDPAQAKLFGG